MAEEKDTSSVAALKRWLAKPPRGAAYLVVLVPGEASEKLALAEIATGEDQKVTPAMADEIAQMVADHAEALGQSVSAVLQFQRTDRSVLQTKVHRHRYVPEDTAQPGDETLARLPAMTGETQAMLAQAQLHLERSNRALMTFVASVLQEQRKMNASVLDTLERVTAMHASTLETVEAERAARHSAEDEARAAESTQQDDKTVERVGELMAKVLPAMLQKPPVS